MEKKIPLGWAIVAAGLLAQPAPKQFEVGGDYARMLNAHLDARAAAALDARAGEIANLKSRESVQARQKLVRERMLAIIGGLPTEKSPLNARVTGRFDGDGYRVENVIFESQPGFRVTANLYLPVNAQPPFPAVLGVAGHSTNGKASATYQHAWIGFAKRGYAVLAYDPPGQGERLEYLDPDTGRSRPGIGVQEHIMAGTQCLLTGSTFARYEIWDGVRALDYLLTRPEIDPKRIAVAGNSGGGTQAAYLAVFEPRLAAIVASCYITGWRELWSGPGPQDAEQIFPGFLGSGLDFPDFLLAAAPKPFLMTTAIRDFFPIAGARSTHREAVNLFEQLGASEKAGYFEFDDTHGWSQPRRQAAYRWLDKWFQSKNSDGAEPPIETLPESRLYATSTGQLATSGGSETVQSLNARTARELKSRRPAADRPAIVRTLGLNAPLSFAAHPAGATTLDAIADVEKYEFEVAPNVRIPALLYLPRGAAGKAPAIVHADPAGKSVPAIAEFVKAGHIVLAIDPRGSGESYPRPQRGGYSPEYQLAARAWLLGGSIVAMQVDDLRSAIQWLARHPRVDATRVKVMGKAALGPVALIAAAVEPSASAVAIENSIVSYQQFAEAKLHDGLYSQVIPGVLRHFDLEDAMRLIAPRPVWIVSAVSPTGVPMRDIAVRELVPASAVIREKPEDWPATKIYKDWLR